MHRITVFPHHHASVRHQVLLGRLVPFLYRLADTSIGNLDVEPSYIWGADAGSIDRNKWHTFNFSANSIRNGELILVYKSINDADIKAGLNVSGGDYAPTLTLHYRNIQGISDYPAESFGVDGATAHVNMVNRSCRWRPAGWR